MNEAIYRERADAALQKIGMMLGTSDEWPDQESMISDVVSRVETALSKKYVQTSDKEARESSAVNEHKHSPDECGRECAYYDYFEMLWNWFADESRNGAEDMRANMPDGLSADDFKAMLDEHEAALMPDEPQRSVASEHPISQGMLRTQEIMCAADMEAKIAALAHRFWSIHPSSLDDMGLTREEFYAREMKKLLIPIEPQGARKP